MTLTPSSSSPVLLASMRSRLSRTSGKRGRRSSLTLLTLGGVHYSESCDDAASALAGGLLADVKVRAEEACAAGSAPGAGEGDLHGLGVGAGAAGGVVRDWTKSSLAPSDSACVQFNLPSTTYTTIIWHKVSKPLPG
ncbi:hypothetical protein DL96DRAFT_1718188 [Flagelloscypha sp. PMI_526]|nr:hypothetical protein DL96DRAFT_1718188 [Flagelloscypha sp. PMI_526]